MQPTLLKHLADQADGIRFAAIPETVRRQCVLTIADTVACMAGGAVVPDAQRVILAEVARNGPGNVTVLGSSTRLSMEGAARANGYMGDIHELNDLTCGHAGIGNVAAVLAMGEAVSAGGLALIEALCIGIEVTSRIYSAFYSTMKPYTDVGMVSVGPAGSAGAAAACARLLGLNGDGVLHAMANAMAQAGWCPAEVIFGDGGTTKPLLFGSMPAAAGIIGALYAREGVTGPEHLLEGPMGYLRTVGLSYDSEAITRTDIWYLDGARRKLHACCGYIHSAMDSLIALRQAGYSAGDVTQIDVHLPAYIVPAVSKAGPPRTPNEARFHSQYMLALAFLAEDVIMPTHSDSFDSHLQMPELRRLMDSITIHTDPTLQHYHFSRVELYGAQDQLLVTRSNDAPKGSARNPLSDAEIWDKLRRQSRTLCSQDAVERYIARLDQLEQDSAPIGWILGDLNQAALQRGDA